ICCITCSIHPTEVGGTLMTPDLLHHLTTDDSALTRAILDQVVILLVPSLNPDGWELVVDWHDTSVKTAHEGTIPPGLYHPVAGHDNNRDWFMHHLSETRAVIERVHRRWHPHIVHDVHQMSSFGPRFVVPPFTDPYDPFVHPVLQVQANELGTTIAAELTARGMAGVAISTIFDAFSASRAYQHYHGGVRILSEAANARLASPLPIAQDQLVTTHGFDPHRAEVRHPLPWGGGNWSVGDIVRYDRAAVDTTLRHAATNRDRWVRNFATVQGDALRPGGAAAFVIPALHVQPDPAVAHDLLRILMAGDVEITVTTGPTDAAGHPLPAGSFVVAMGQPFGAYARTVLTNQPYTWGDTGATPYDTTTHALPLMMGVTCLAVDDLPPVETHPLTGLPELPGHIEGDVAAVVFRTPATSNASTILVAGALTAGARVRRATVAGASPDGNGGVGDFLIADLSRDSITALAASTGASVHGERALPAIVMTSLALPRVAVVQTWRGSATDAGWTRFVLAQHGIDATILRPADLREGVARSRHDAIVVASEPDRNLRDGLDSRQYPAEWAGGIDEAGLAGLRAFGEDGGTVVSLGEAAGVVIEAFDLPVTNVAASLGKEVYAAPGALIGLDIDPAHPLAWGYPATGQAMVVGPVLLDLTREEGEGLTVAARYRRGDPVVAGWMRGARRLAGRPAVIEARSGARRVILIAFRPQFRGQTAGTYRWLFNALWRSVAS
ncbi:MAG: hypothetical protein M3462_09085, partial [Chloroflexota bacterium]|nr:hypothetical protein [Chloroflexota bacterium]